jgi:hypothetical protein
MLPESDFPTTSVRVILFLVIWLGGVSHVKAQKIEGISFHLYTDSLKKGQYNYINVDAKLSDGKWRPLTTKELDFTCSQGRFEGNDLIIPEFFPYEKVTVKAVLRSDPEIAIEKVIWIKQQPDTPLPRKERFRR